MRATGTETSCLMLPPSGFCASESGLAQPPEVARLRQRSGDRRVDDEAALAAARSASVSSRSAAPSALRPEISISAYQGCCWRTDRACRACASARGRDDAGHELEGGEARGRPSPAPG